MNETNRWPAAAWLEACAVVLVFVATTGLVPPEENEPNYLAKARHFWDPQWAAGDVYLDSADAHWLFCMATGWLTQLVDLATDVNNRRDPHIASTQSGRVVGDYRESFDAVVEVGALSAELAAHLKPSMGPGTF